MDAGEGGTQGGKDWIFAEGADDTRNGKKILMDTKTAMMMAALCSEHLS